MRTIRPVCSRCVYWAENSAVSPATMGHCHRYPPVVVAGKEGGSVVQKFPATGPRHWCGEWSADDSRFIAGVAKGIADSAAARTQPETALPG